MFDFIRAAMIHESGEMAIAEKIRKKHLSNHAVDTVLDGVDGNKGVFELHRMYEDSDLDGHEEAKEAANFIEALMPGKWILIDTGDYITREGGSFYDGYYALILIHVDTFTRYEDDLIRTDERWREEKWSELEKPGFGVFTNDTETYVAKSIEDCLLVFKELIGDDYVADHYGEESDWYEPNPDEFITIFFEDATGLDFSADGFRIVESDPDKLSIKVRALPRLWAKWNGRGFLCSTES